MEQNRFELHEIFATILGSRNVYYQPPSSVRMKYPAIVYDRKNIDNNHANNSIYKRSICYEVTLIDEDPDSEFIEKILDLPMCKFDRHFFSEDLNHNVFTLYH